MFDYPRVDGRTAFITHARVARRAPARRRRLRRNGRYFDSTPPCILRSVPPSSSLLSRAPPNFPILHLVKKTRNFRRKGSKDRSLCRWRCTRAPLSEPGQSIDVEASFARVLVRSCARRMNVLVAPRGGGGSRDLRGSAKESRVTRHRVVEVWSSARDGKMARELVGSTSDTRVRESSR